MKNKYGILVSNINVLTVYFYYYRNSLGDRLKSETGNVKFLGSIGNREMTFKMNKGRHERDRREQNKKHKEERRKLHRPTNHLSRPKFKSQKGR